jgi:hypothetical protein
MARCIALAISRLILKLFVVKHNTDRRVVSLELAKSTVRAQASLNQTDPLPIDDARSRRQEQQAGKPIPPLAPARAVCYCLLLPPSAS